MGIIKISKLKNSWICFLYRLYYSCHLYLGDIGNKILVYICVLLLFKGSPTNFTFEVKSAFPNSVYRNIKVIMCTKTLLIVKMKIWRKKLIHFSPLTHTPSVTSIISTPWTLKEQNSTCSESCYYYGWGFWWSSYDPGRHIANVCFYFENVNCFKQKKKTVWFPNKNAMLY